MNAPVKGVGTIIRRTCSGSKAKPTPARLVQRPTNVLRDLQRIRTILGVGIDDLLLLRGPRQCDPRGDERGRDRPRHERQRPQRLRWVEFLRTGATGINSGDRVKRSKEEWPLGAFEIDAAILPDGAFEVHFGRPLVRIKLDTQTPASPARLVHGLRKDFFSRICGLKLRSGDVREYVPRRIWPLLPIRDRVSFGR